MVGSPESYKEVSDSGRLVGDQPDASTSSVPDDNDVDSDHPRFVDSLGMIDSPESETASAFRTTKPITAVSNSAGASVADDGVSKCPSSTSHPGERSVEVDGKDAVVSSMCKRPNVHRSSNYIGVTRHRWSGKFEAHLWDSAWQKEGRRRKGRQVYIGSYDSEEKAARAHDVAALKYWGLGPGTKLNFPASDYEREIEEVRNMSQEECVASLRRKSSCFSRGASAYRGVTRRQKDGCWQARIGHVAGSKDIYLGSFKTETEAAEAYDIAAVRLRGANAVTNFNIRNYLDINPEGLEKA